MLNNPCLKRIVNGCIHMVGLVIIPYRLRKDLITFLYKIHIYSIINYQLPITNHPSFTYVDHGSEYIAVLGAEVTGYAKPEIQPPSLFDMSLYL